ncbi:MAG: ABC transporter [Rickettsiales bacterium]|nr:ABC transporter [Rickettsiales bacterium]|tara:strand:+ start:6305 stop:7030 length:726 start_codon:yes stop_codon:yes gene_type:complete
MNTNSQCELVVDSLTVSFGNFQALQDINLCFPKGSLTAIIGPNGGGKSTLMKCVTGQLQPTNGRIYLHGISPDKISYVPQKSLLDTSFPITVREVAAMGLISKKNLYRSIPSEQINKLDHTLNEMGLSNQKDQLVETLSGGQFQRLLFARLLLQDQPLIILDEPFAHIDEHTKEVLLSMIQNWHKKGKTIIVILHELDLVKRFFPNAVLLAKEVISNGKTAEVMSEKNIASAFKKLLENTA